MIYTGRMEAGDRVRLTDKAARSRAYGWHGKRSRIEWATRVGTVLRFNPRNRQGQTFVVWDGNKTPEQIAVVELEVIDD
jgi:hypothetical protein